MSAGEKLLAVRDVMMATSLSRATVYRLVARGELRPVRLCDSGKLLFPHSELQDWISARLSERTALEQAPGTS